MTFSSKSVVNQRSAALPQKILKWFDQKSVITSCNWRSLSTGANNFLTLQILKQPLRLFKIVFLIVLLDLLPGLWIVLQIADCAVIYFSQP